MDACVALNIEPPLHHSLASTVAGYAYQALIKEVELTPKPGLVDQANTGAHRDMDIATFRASAAAIAPWFRVFFQHGLEGCRVPAQAFLPSLRQAGMACEQDMFRATGGVNTHKGSIFSLGLLSAAAGRMCGNGRALDREALCHEVAQICADLVENELQHKGEASTAGERLFKQHGLKGARGEVASGFSTVRQHALPAFERFSGKAEESTALHASLLALLAHNQDTNVVSRGGMEGLAFMQARAHELLAAGGVAAPSFTQDFIELDAACIARNLSPGGSADLLAVTWFLSRFPASPDTSD